MKENDDTRFDPMQEAPAEFFWQFLTWDVLFPWVGVVISSILSSMFEEEKLTVLACGVIISIMVCVSRACLVGPSPMEDQSAPKPTRFIGAVAILFLFVFEVLANFTFIADSKEQQIVVATAATYVGYLACSYWIAQQRRPKREEW